MTKNLTRYLLFFMTSGVLFASWNHFTDKGFNQAIDWPDFLMDFMVFGLVVTLLSQVDRYLSKKKTK